MGKKPTPEEVAWQEAARERLRVVLERKFGSNQSRLATALGVTQALVNIVIRSVQPPTRNLMAKLGAIEGVNPHWAHTGVGVPFGPDTHGTLPISDVLLPGPPANHISLMTGERIAVAPAFDRPTCYCWRFQAGHPALAVGDWALLPGDLALLDSSPDVVSRPSAWTGKHCVIHGRCLRQSEPVYGVIATDAKGRVVFGDGQTRLRSDDFPREIYAPSTAPPSLVAKKREKRRTIRDLEERGRRIAEMDTDPWYALPEFNITDVLAVQLLLIRQ
ncbi:MAG: hypothetical protein K8U57_34355 [Planctomycetes bacterium]|nr:hypothetical protein [Planctomycetota bacterium]